MKLEIIKRIRSKDKDLRESIKGFPLFSRTFKHLRDMEEIDLKKVENWYDNLIGTSYYLDLRKLYKQNTLEYWKEVQRNYPHLSEYRKLKYLLQIFVVFCKGTMPMELKHDYLDPSKES